MSKKSATSQEPIVINGDDEVLLYVRDRRKPSQFSIDNVIMDQWYPIIDAIGFSIYALLIRMANESNGESCYPGYTMITGHLGIGPATLSYYISLLEWCQLIYRDRPEIVIIQNGERKTRRQGNRSNTYYILEVTHVTPERLALVREKVVESANKQSGGLTKEWGEKFTRAIDSWKPLQSHWAVRRRKKIKTVVSQTSMFDGDQIISDPPPPVSADSAGEKRHAYLVDTQKIFADFGIVGSPAKELADADESVVLAWVWQCQIEEMEPKKAPGFVVKRLRLQDSPGEDKLGMAYSWLTMKAEDRETMQSAVQYGSGRLSEQLDEDFLPDLMSESFDFYEKAHKVGALYTDI